VRSGCVVAVGADRRSVGRPTPTMITYPRIKVISLLLLLGLGLVYLAAYDDYFNPAKNVSLGSQEFENRKELADKGSRKACNDVAVIYDYYEKYTESVKYWNCSIDENDIYKSAGMKHLASYHFHGFGVDADPAKGAMYLVLSENNVWPRNKDKKLRPWLGHIPYADISDINDIEGNFEKGARLAKDYIENNNITDPRLTDDQLDKNLKRHLSSLAKVDRKILLRHVIFLIALLGFILGLVQWFSRNRR